MKLRQAFLKVVSQERGSALVAAVIFSAIIAIVAAYAYRSTVFQRRIADRSQDYLAALAVAEAGAELAMVELNKPETSTPVAFDGWTGSSKKALTEDITDGDGNLVGEVVVEVSKLDTTGPLVVATGHIPSVKNSKIARTVQLVTQNDTIPSPFGSFGIFSFTNIGLSGNSLVDSYDSSKGAYNVNGNKGSSGNVGAFGNIAMQGNPDVMGNVQAGGSVTTQGNVTVAGDKISKSMPTAPPEIEVPEFVKTPPATNDNNKIEIYDSKGKRFTVPSSGSAKNAVTSGNSDVNIPAPGTYVLNKLELSGNGNLNITGNGKVTIYVDQGDFDLVGNGDLNLGAGVEVDLIAKNVKFNGNNDLVVSGEAPLNIFVENMHMNGNKDLVIKNGAKVTINVANDLSMNGNGDLNVGPDAKPTSLQIFGGKNIFMAGNKTVYGGLYTTSANVKFTGNSEWFGAIIAKDITHTGNLKVHVDHDLIKPTGGDGVYVNAWLETKAGK